MAASYWLTILVTVDQELAIHNLFRTNGWTLLKQVPKGGKSLASSGSTSTVMENKNSTDTEVRIIRKDNVPPVKTFSVSEATKSQILNDIIRRGRFITLEKRPNNSTVKSGPTITEIKTVPKTTEVKKVPTAREDNQQSLNTALENIDDESTAVKTENEKQEPDKDSDSDNQHKRPHHHLSDDDGDSYDGYIDDSGSDTNMSEVEVKQERRVSDRKQACQKNDTTKSPKKAGKITNIKLSPNSKAGQVRVDTLTTESSKDNSVTEEAASNKNAKKKVFIVRKNTKSNTNPSAAMVLVNEDCKAVIKKDNATKDPPKKLKPRKPRVYSKKVLLDFQHITEAKISKNKKFELDPGDVDDDGFVKSLSEYYCKLCKCLFRTESLYTSHRKDGECDFVCSETGCNARFGDYFECKRHCQEHAPAERLSKEKMEELLEQRKQRNLKMKQYRSKKKRKRKPVKPRDYICETCGNSYKSLSGYLEHKHRKHSDGGKPPYSCCDMPFFSKSHYMRHMCRIHNGPKPYLCDICGDGFAVNNDLQRHKMRHGTNKFSCKICGANYLQVKGAFEDHMAMHRKEKNHVCQCGRRFTHRSSLGKHKPKCELLNKDQNVRTKTKTKRKTSISTETNDVEDSAETYIAKAAESFQPVVQIESITVGQEQVVEHMGTIYMETVCLDSM